MFIWTFLVPSTSKICDFANIFESFFFCHKNLNGFFLHAVISWNECTWILKNDKIHFIFLRSHHDVKVLDDLSKYDAKPYKKRNITILKKTCAFNDPTSTTILSHNWTWLISYINEHYFWAKLLVFCLLRKAQQFNFSKSFIQFNETKIRLLKWKFSHFWLPSLAFMSLLLQQLHQYNCLAVQKYQFVLVSVQLVEIVLKPQPYGRIRTL